jgi:hypothetical protein
VPLYYKIVAINELGESVETTGSYEPGLPSAGAHAASHQAGGGDPLTGSLDPNARVAVRKNSTGASVGERRRLNLIEAGDVMIAVADDAAGEELDITISANPAAAVADAASANAGASYDAAAQALINESKAQVDALLASLRAANKLGT